MAIFNFIYMFHMPLFIFISGRFSQISNQQKFLRGIASLCSTYILFQVIRTIIDTCQTGHFSLLSLITPNWILWYLVALCLWRLGIFVISILLERYNITPKQIIIGSFFIGIGIGLLPIENEFALQRTLGFLPFFVIGFFSARLDLKKRIGVIYPVFAATVLIIAFLVLFILNKNFQTVHTMSYSYWDEMSVDVHQFLARFASRIFYYPIALILCVMVMRLCTDNHVMAKYGKYTLFIYIYHAFCIDILKYFVSSYNLPQSTAMLLLYSVIIGLLLLVASHIKILKQILKPYEILQHFRQYHTG